jgi:serpin B
LEIANRVYAATGFELNPSFTKIISESFRAEIEQLDFSQQTTAARKINGWVEQVTRNRIKDLISPGTFEMH